MSNIVLLTAGGVGSRTKQSIPKQFLSVQDKPIIIYTMEKFQNCNEIDFIIVSCLDGWESCLLSYAKQFGISKLKAIVSGGKTGFESICNGLKEISTFADANDIVLIHDGNRPNVDDEIINNCILTAKTKGPAITTIPMAEVVYDMSTQTPKLLNRDNLVRVQTPHAASFGFMNELYTRAINEGKTDRLGFCGLLTEYGYNFNIVSGGERNFKITYQDEIAMFKGLILLENK